MPVAPTCVFLVTVITRQAAAGGQTTSVTPPCWMLFRAALKSR